MEGNPPKPYLDDHPPCDQQKSTELFEKGFRFAAFPWKLSDYRILTWSLVKWGDVASTRGLVTLVIAGCRRFLVVVALSNLFQPVEWFYQILLDIVCCKGPDI